MSKQLSRGARRGRNIVIGALVSVVTAALVLLLLPDVRATLIPPTAPDTTRSAPPPAGFVAQRTVGSSPPLFDPVEADAAPPAAQLAARFRALADEAGKASVVVLDPATGRSLLARRDRPMIPASTMKLITGLAALDGLGAGATFRTEALLARGGVVVLRGGGDPLLADARTPGRASLADLAAATALELRRRGTTRVTLGYDARLFGGRGWHPHWTDNYRYSVAPISALVADHGRTRTGLAEKDPAAAAAERFAKRLRQAGITVRAPRPMAATPGAAVLADVASPPLDRIVETMLRLSDNDAAETLARHLGLATGRGGSFTDGTAAIRATLTRLGAWRQGMVLDDASGLSRGNRVTPGALAALMRLVVAEPRLRPLLPGLPVAGATGTLFDRFDDRAERAGRGAVRAKTGSLRDVSSLAGVLTSADGATIVFAILVNDVRRPLAVRDWIDRTTATWAACGCG